MSATPSPRWSDVGLLALVLGVAVLVRMHDLAARPMHADEANQAVKLGQMLAGGHYRFDPHDHHGPTLYYFGLLAAKLRGESALATLRETTVRLVPAVAGVAAVGLLWLLLRRLGRTPALLAALLLAVSPAAVYYSRYFIQETLLVTFTLGAFVCGAEWWRKGGWGWATGTGICFGLMLATKASALLYAAGALVALAACRRGGKASWREAGFAGVVALGVVAAFYSSFGTNHDGLREAVHSLNIMFFKATAGESGHEKSWWYYARLFVWQRNGGYIWDQSLFVMPALVGAALAWRRGGLVRFFAIYTVMIAVVLSLAPYKTPWQVVNVVPGLCVLAALGIARLEGRLMMFYGSVVVLSLGWQMWQAVFLRPADERNPFAYVHTVPDMLKVPALASAAPAGAVKVIGCEYWPLPWYLRRRPETGYWTEPPEDCDGVLVFVDADQADAVRGRLNGKYQESFLGLRPGVVVVVFTRLAE
ncbi:MAG TPA: flippase activity-associated protein Agl23 [Lacunisphaera sp.]